MFTLVAFAFFRVKSDIHIFIVCTLISKSNVDSQSSGRYTALAAAKSVAGRGNPELITEHNRSCGFFVLIALSHQSMVGRAGQLSGWPVSVVAGISTPVRLTTSRRGNLGGGLHKPTIEAAIMATIPPRFIFIFSAVRKNDPDATPVYLHARTNTERQARKCHEAFYDLELIQCSRNSNSRRPHIIQEVSQ